MFNSSNTTNQPAPMPMPEQSRQKFEMTPPRKRFSSLKVPLVAQVSGLLSLLVLGAGLLTVNQLSQSPQQVETQAATGDVLLEFSEKTATLTPGQEKTFFIKATPSNDNLKISAAIIRLRNEHSQIAQVTNIVPVPNMLPVTLKAFPVEMQNSQVTQHAITLGADPLKPVTGTKSIVQVTVKAQKAGKAIIEIAENSEIAAFNNSSSVMKRYEGANAQKNLLTIDVKTSEPPSASDICVSKTATKVVGSNRETLAANAKVNPGDVIEYTVAAQTRQDTTVVAFDDRFPTAVLSYVANSAKIDGTNVTVDATQITKNILLAQREVTAANRGKQIKLTYQVKVKEGTAGREFANNANVKLNNNDQLSDYCELSLMVNSETEPPQSTEARLHLNFRVQGINKAGVTLPAEVVVRYKKKNSSEIVTKTFNQDFTSIAAQQSPGRPAGTLTAPLIILTGINMAEVDKLPNSGNSGSGIEVFVKTPTTLRKKLGELSVQQNQAPVILQGVFLSDNQELLVGDFNRESGQVNKFRLTDLVMMRNQYFDVSNVVTDSNREFDVNFDGVFNFTDYVMVYNNYKQILLEGDNP